MIFSVREKGEGKVKGNILVTIDNLWREFNVSRHCSFQSFL